MNKKTLTIFTPAYNRAYTIGRTYESLCRQTSKDFCWLVVDDGSVDNTKELIEKWIGEDKISIRYIYQQNQGMHGAHNTAYRNIDTELNTCIDSDDYMPDDAVEKIVAFWKKYGSEKYAGIIGLDKADKGEVIGTRFPAGLKETTVSGFYQSGGSGDKKMVYRTDVIKKYPEYPIFKGEKYVSLGYKYLLIDQDYKLLTVNEPLVIVDYQQDGSSMNMFRQYWNNPKGFAFLRKVHMKYYTGYKLQMRTCTHYVAHCMRASNWQMIQESPLPWKTLLCLVPGLIEYIVTWYMVKSKRLLKIK